MPLPVILLIVLLAIAVAVVAYEVQADRERRALLERVNAPDTSAVLLKTTRESLPTRLGKWIQGRVPTAWADRQQMSERLLHAGFDGPSAAAVYGVLWVSSSIVVPLAALALAPRRNTAFYVAVFVAAVAVGLLAPRAALDRLAQPRHEKLRRALPDAMDLLVVCVEAGISLDAAILRVAKEMATLHPELAEEFLIVNRRVNAGITRERALHGLWVRTGLEDLRGLASNMIQTERWGTSIATVLRVYAETLRRKRKQAAERKAATAPLKMLFPLGVFIFPSIFVVIIGPALIKIYGMFKHMPQ
jgi:tight adherence protein C